MMDPRPTDERLLEQRLLEQRLPDQSLLAQIDACRPGTDDLRGPALGGLASALARGDDGVRRMLSQVEAADAAIAAALQDVEVPDDLADRLLVALKAAEHGEPEDAAALRRQTAGGHAVRTATDSDRTTALAAASPACRTERTSRRAWLGWTVGLTAAAALALVCAFYPWSPEFVTSEEIAQQIYVLYDTEIALVEPEAWTPGAPVNQGPAFDEGVFPQPQRWRELKVGRYPAIAYDLTGEGAQKRATLLVIDRRVQGLDISRPDMPVSTQGRCVGVWQSETQVFALIVEGTINDYQQIIASQAIA